VKPLVTATDIKNLVGTGKKVLYFEPGTLVTPSAKDACREAGIKIEFGTAPAEREVECCAEVTESPVCCEVPAVGDVSPEMISRIVMEVIANLPRYSLPRQMVKQVDPTGVSLVKGNTVECDSFDTGNPNDKVGIKEVFTLKESPDMATGFMTLDKTAFDWHLMYDEIDYVIEGTLDIIVNGKTYRGQAGDVLFIPRDTKITFSTPDKAKFFFVTYPANWAELSGYGKKN
jgi:ethanolamine utilization protein EutQ